MRYPNSLHSKVGFSLVLLSLVMFICSDVQASDQSLPAMPAAAATLFTALVPISDPANGSEDFFGFSVSLSADGNTALVGSPGADVSGATLAGKVYVFTRSGGSWSSAPVATFTEPNAQSNNEFGFSVALSADGNTALVGTCCTPQNGQGGAGAAYVFTRSGGNWSPTPVATLVEPSAGANHHFGVSVALAGTTALVGAPDSNGSDGATYVFAENGGSWSLSATFSGSTNGGGFGTVVALSADAGTALVGAPKVNSGAGEAYIFTASGGAWIATPAASLVNPGAGNDGFGSSVALANGVALIGAPRDMQGSVTGAGAAYVYTASGGVWPTTPSVTLAEPIPGAGNQFGVSAALSADGSTAFIGARNGSSSKSYLYRQSSGVWATNPGASFNEPDPLADANFSSSLALSNDGSTAMLGAPNIIYAIADSTADLLALAMTSAPTTVNVGQGLTYSFTVSNNSTSDVTGLTLTDSLPANVTFVSATTAGGACNNNNNTVTCTLPTLAVAGQWQPSITVNAVNAGTPKNSASVSATANDPFMANNTASVINTINAENTGGGGGSGGGGGGGGGALGGVSLLILGLLVRRKRRLHC